MRTRGCSGLTYTLDYSSEKKQFDEEVMQDGKCDLYTLDHTSLCGEVVDALFGMRGLALVHENSILVLYPFHPVQ